MNVLSNQDILLRHVMAAFSEVSSASSAIGSEPVSATQASFFPALNRPFAAGAPKSFLGLPSRLAHDPRRPPRDYSIPERAAYINLTG
jgi:hypothetical protein